MCASVIVSEPLSKAALNTVSVRGALNVFDSKVNYTMNAVSVGSLLFRLVQRD